MNIHIHTPQSGLREAVHFFWWCQANSFDAMAITLPLACHEFVFTQSDGFEVGNYSRSYSTQPYTSWFSGMHTEPVITQAHGRHVSVGMMLKPWGVYQLFGVAARELADTVVESSLLAGSKLEDFIAGHISMPGAELLAAMERFVCRQYALHPVRDSVRKAATAITNASPERGIVSRMAEEVAVSSRTFIASFADTIGLTPVQYLHVSRVNHALAMIADAADIPLTDIALQLGFYDQAHFIRVFKALCKLSPRTYRRYAASHRLPGAAPNSLLFPATQYNSNLPASFSLH